jgi:hypothetical protein
MTQLQEVLEQTDPSILITIMMMNNTHLQEVERTDPSILIVMMMFW